MHSLSVLASSPAGAVIAMAAHSFSNLLAVCSIASNSSGVKRSSYCVMPKYDDGGIDVCDVDVDVDVDRTKQALHACMKPCMKEGRKGLKERLKASAQTANP